jgi:hypothetical protein
MLLCIQDALFCLTSAYQTYYASSYRYFYSFLHIPDRLLPMQDAFYFMMPSASCQAAAWPYNVCCGAWKVVLCQPPGQRSCMKVGKGVKTTTTHICAGRGDDGVRRDDGVQRETGHPGLDTVTSAANLLLPLSAPVSNMLSAGASAPWLPQRLAVTKKGRHNFFLSVASLHPIYDCYLAGRAPYL